MCIEATPSHGFPPWRELQARLARIPTEIDTLRTATPLGPGKNLWYNPLPFRVPQKGGGVQNGGAWQRPIPHNPWDRQTGVANCSVFDAGIDWYHSN
jgi:hypothetical protein